MTGYDARFLGPDDAVHVPLPAPAPDAPPRTLRRLDHPHFTVLLDPARRLAAATGVMIDGARLQPLPRTGGWRLDPQAPEHEQAGPELYHRNALDRGHLVRRRDPMWGTVAEAVAAGEATFVYTNAAPQVGRFNQSKELWNGLEDHVLAYAQAHEHRLVVLTGCVLAADDPVYRGVGIPRRFWKIAAWAAPSWRVPDDGGPVAPAASLRAAAFVLDQSPQLEEVELRTRTARALAAGELPPLGPFRTFQVPVADVAALTGTDLGPLPAADVLPAAGPRPEGVPPSGTVPGGWREITAPTDLRV
ncbi:DNA/RNA non-specific endonuclease [Isoptericola variabilis]|uniref:DNA/RNA non-specific endonuclease n=1 Tax=Isoptericola variabilis (strain 225) TaxID=743718 RepID=F6FW60_ISOV2|nr:DNA/RNA non-specific endonuclease [Isoptericola variabilis]AEG45604.1 DNA/RNA non-specific endonuclease [Isoptericola variabilis 225]TWH25788.1 endonuclease G [Isoptericola variabilis J7]